MRRQSGYEDDWIRSLNEAGNLANTLSQTKARGLQTQIIEQEMADKKRKEAIANTMTTGLSMGETPENLSKIKSTGEGWSDDFRSINAGLTPGDRDYVPAAGFSRSSDTPVGAAEVQAGLNDAMKRSIEAYKADFEMKKNKVAPIIKSLPMDKLNTLDFEQFGENAEAARAVFADDIKTRAESAQYKKQFDDAIRAGIEQHWKGWSSSVGLADESIEKGNRVDAMAYVNTAINVHNSDSRKFEVNPETGTSGKFYIIQQGKKVYDDKEYGVEDVLKMMKEKTPQQFNDHNWAAAKEAQVFNGDMAKDPVMLFNRSTGKVLSATAEKDPITSSVKWVVHDNGKIVFRGDLQKMYDLGYVSSEGKEKIDANTRRGLAIRNDELQNQNAVKEGFIKDAQLKATKARANGGGVDKPVKENIQVLKDRRAQATKALAQELWANGIDVTYNSDTGDIDPGEKAMLTQAQRDKAAAIAAKHGFNAAFRPVEDGIDNGWFRDDTVGYRFGGVSGFEAPGAKGLSRSGTNQGKSGPVMSRGEFDATITGQENKQPPVKTGKGLIERAYNSVVPADGFADTVVKKGFGPIPGQAKELAGVVYEKGLKPIPGQVKGVAKAVAKPFAAPYSAAAKLTKLKVLKNQLSHAESDKEKKEIKAEIEALSKSK